MLKEFRDFALRGNAFDMAVGIIIGGAFGAIVQSLVNDLLMPAIGLLLGGADFSNLFLVLQQGNPAGPYATLEMAQQAGAVTLNYGVFANTLITFLIVSFALFLLIRSINRLRAQPPAEPAAPTTKECPYCFTSIPIQAVRCPHCTSDL